MSKPILSFCCVRKRGPRQRRLKSNTSKIKLLGGGGGDIDDTEKIATGPHGDEAGMEPLCLVLDMAKTV